MQIFKRYSAAIQAAGDAPILKIQGKSGAIYIVGVERLDEVSILTAPNSRGSRLTAGHVSLGHLSRLGNANAAAAERYHPDPADHAFSQKGLTHVFRQPEDQSRFDADRDAAARAAKVSA